LVVDERDDAAQGTREPISGPLASPLLTLPPCEIHIRHIPNLPHRAADL
jgi:hypothetical protein